THPRSSIFPYTTLFRSKGLEPEQYMSHLDKHKDSFYHIYNNFQLPADEEFFNRMKDKNLRVVALAEVWCGHCMLDIPILLHMCEDRKSTRLNSSHVSFS